MNFTFQYLIITLFIILYVIFPYYFPPPVIDTYVSENAITDPQIYTDLNAFSSQVQKCDLGMTKADGGVNKRLREWSAKKG